jgi:uncharacterized protein (DUF433 family)
MPLFETRLFTTTEAAAVTGLPVTAVNHAIDNKVISAVSGTPSGRRLDFCALLSLTLERRLAKRFTPEARREVFQALAKRPWPHKLVIDDDGLVNLDFRAPRDELATSLRALRRARQLVVTDPEIKGGEPVFRGTRLQVHLIATLIEKGSPEAELLESYPSLTPEMLHLAPIYAAAYPARGRPRKQPWHDKPPVISIREKLSDLNPSLTPLGKFPATSIS